MILGKLKYTLSVALLLAANLVAAHSHDHADDSYAAMREKAPFAGMSTFVPWAMRNQQES